MAKQKQSTVTIEKITRADFERMAHKYVTHAIDGTFLPLCGTHGGRVFMQVRDGATHDPRVTCRVCVRAMRARARASGRPRQPRARKQT